jgi:hypothetical protein
MVYELENEDRITLKTFTGSIGYLRIVSYPQLKLVGLQPRAVWRCPSKPFTLPNSPTDAGVPHGKLAHTGKMCGWFSGHPWAMLRLATPSRFTSKPDAGAPEGRLAGPVPLARDTILILFSTAESVFLSLYCRVREPASSNWW